MASICVLLPYMDELADKFDKEIDDAAWDFDSDTLKVRFKKKEA